MKKTRNTRKKPSDTPVLTPGNSIMLHSKLLLVVFLLISFSKGEAMTHEIITGVHFEGEIYRSGTGDNWHITWANDDHQYTALCDGEGWENADSYNTRVYRIKDDAPNFIAEFLPSYPYIPMKGSVKSRHWYGYGILAIDGKLYHFISYLDKLKPTRFIGAKLVYSPDNGGTWKNRDGSPMAFPDAVDPEDMFFWDRENSSFVHIAILQYGKNYQDNKDGYVYLYATNGYTDNKMRQLAMARVPKEQIIDKEAYEYFVSRNADGTANWSGDFSKRGVVHSFPANWVANNFSYSWHPSVVYNKALDLYMMTAAGTGKGQKNLLRTPSYLGIYTAPSPWGPWTQIHEDKAWKANGDDGSRLYEPVIAPRWISADGKFFWLVFSDCKDQFDRRYYRFCIQKVRLATASSSTIR